MTTATPIEIKKDGLSQLQDGSWVLKVKIHPDDMTVDLMKAHMGTRYMAALVEIGDDEQPVAPEKPTEVPTEPERRHLRDMHRASQAGMLCDDARFQQFLKERYRAHIDPTHEMATKDQADKALKTILEITSKTQLDNDPEKARHWDQMRSDYLAWCQT